MGLINHCAPLSTSEVGLNFGPDAGSTGAFGPSWWPQPGLKGEALVPVGGTNRYQRPPLPILWAAEKEAFGPGWWHQPGLKGALVPVCAINRDQCSLYISSTSQFCRVHRHQLPPDDAEHIDAARLPRRRPPPPPSPSPSPAPVVVAGLPEPAPASPSPRRPPRARARRRRCQAAPSPSPAPARRAPSPCPVAVARPRAPPPL